jgi:hypothetical protein
MLQQMTVGEILDGTFSLYRRRFGLLFAIALVTQLPGHALQLYLSLRGSLLDAPLLFGVTIIVAWVGALLALGATLKAVSELYLERAVTVGEALGFALGRFWSLLAAGFAKTLLGGLALLLLMVPGIIVFCGYAVVEQVVTLERPPRATDALSRSWELTREHRNRAFGLFLVIVAINLVPQFLAGMAIALSPGTQAVLLTASSLLQLVLTPLYAIAFTLFYYDLRIRKEAFDLELLSSQLSAATV